MKGADGIVKGGDDAVKHSRSVCVQKREQPGLGRVQKDAAERAAPAPQPPADESQPTLL